MSTPNPLIPQGSLHRGGNSNVRLAVATVLAIHVVFFGGLLLQGCKRDPAATGTKTETNPPASALKYAPIDSNSLFYPSSKSLPADAASNALAAPAQPANPAPDPAFRTAPPAQDTWKQAITPAPAASETPAGKEYTVVRGDNFARIAKAQGSTVAAIRKANPQVDPAKIQPGMKLTVPGAEAAASAPAVSGEGYTVKTGDNLTKIAKANGVTVGQLRAANQLKTSRVVVGQKLKIPPAGLAPAKAPVSNVSTNATF